MRFLGCDARKRSGVPETRRIVFAIGPLSVACVIHGVFLALVSRRRQYPNKFCWCPRFQSDNWPRPAAFTGRFKSDPRHTHALACPHHSTGLPKSTARALLVGAPCGRVRPCSVDPPSPPPPHRLCSPLACVARPCVRPVRTGCGCNRCWRRHRRPQPFGGPRVCRPCAVDFLARCWVFVVCSSPGCAVSPPSPLHLPPSAAAAAAVPLGAAAAFAVGAAGAAAAAIVTVTAAAAAALTARVPCVPGRARIERLSGTGAFTIGAHV